MERGIKCIYDIKLKAALPYERKQYDYNDVILKRTRRKCKNNNLFREKQKRFKENKF